jgi:glycosyltransferase involved in cell wall biosynthesis
MITRRVDRADARAGFAHSWVGYLALLVDELHVICLEKGDVSGLPKNCFIYSLGKEHGKNRWNEFLNFQKFARLLVPKVDGIFSHQNPEYGILIAPWAKWYHKRLIAWYTHKQVTLRLRLLSLLADTMVSASAESFRLPTKKLKVLHHGIDVDSYRYFSKQARSEKVILSVSRISPSKRVDLMILMLAALREGGMFNTRMVIAGDVVLDREKEYLLTLQKLVSEKKLERYVSFIGHVPHYQTVDLYSDADLFLNFSTTGSVDKAVLEAMSCGTPVLVTNEAFKDSLSGIEKNMYSADSDPVILAQRASHILQQGSSEEIRKRLREYVVQNHDIQALMKKIVALYV